MQLTPHFTLEEFIATTHRNINNQLPVGLTQNALLTCNMLERIRTFLQMQSGREIPIYLSSGYRCKQLNDAVGSRDSSDHVKALAADWVAPAFGTPYDVCVALQPQVSNLDIGQLIHEFGRWIHTSAGTPKAGVNRIITISNSGTQPGIVRI